MRVPHRDDRHLGRPARAFDDGHLQSRCADGRGRWWWWPRRYAAGSEVTHLPGGLADEAHELETVFADDLQRHAGHVLIATEVQHPVVAVHDLPRAVDLSDDRVGRIERKGVLAFDRAGGRLIVDEPVFHRGLRRADGAVFVEAVVFDHTNRVARTGLAVAEVAQQQRAGGDHPLALEVSRLDLVGIEPDRRVLGRCFAGRKGDGKYRQRDESVWEEPLEDTNA
ncbi:MAG: hypothetical protein A2107_03545 [Verrucomicrobia bacterium GWF2_62_7]|nr:MAG: hypothetical protein A2107_03545 [Verrucomicrobia bacterium GWF2_62_7]